MSKVSNTNLTSQIITMVIAVVIVGVVLVPIINGLTDSESGDQSTTITNSGIGFAKTDKDDAIHTMIISEDTNGKMKVTVDGQDVAYGPYHFII